MLFLITVGLDGENGRLSRPTRYNGWLETAAELQAVLDEVLMETTAVVAADQWTRDIVLQLRYSQRHHSPASRRRVMRRYGVSFAYREGEEEEIDNG